MGPILYLIVALSGSVWLIVFLVRPKWLVIITVAIVIVQFRWFTRYFGWPDYFNALSLMVVALLGCTLFLRHLAGQKLRTRGAIMKPMMHFPIFLICLTLVSNAYNHEDLVLGIFELRYYFTMVVLTLGIYTFFNSELTLRRLHNIIILIGIAQIPLAALQYISAGGGEVRTLDSVTGTFSTYTELVTSQILAVGLVLLDKQVKKRNFFGINGYVVAFALIIPLLLSKSRTATGFVILMILFVWLYGGVARRSIGFLMTHAYTTVALVVVSGVLFYNFFWQSYDLEKYVETDFVYEYVNRKPIVDYGQKEWVKSRTLGRWSAITEACKYTFADPLHALIGYGSGSASLSEALSRSGRLYQRPGYGTIAGINRSQYSKVLIELGVIGVGGFVFLFVRLYGAIRRTRLGKEFSTVLSTIVWCLVLLSYYGYTLHGFFMGCLLAAFVATAQAEVDRRVGAEYRSYFRAVRPDQITARQ